MSTTSAKEAPSFYPQSGSADTSALFYPSPSEADGTVPDELSGAGVIFLNAYCYSSQLPEDDTETRETRPNSRKFTLSGIKWNTLELHQVFKVPPAPVLESLIEVYFEMCWTWTPVLNYSIREKIAVLASVVKTRRMSLLLLYATLLAGSRMRKGAAGLLSTEEYYTRAKALLDAEVERNPQRLLAALCMFQWWNPADPRDLNLNSAKFWVTYGSNSRGHRLG
jgi:hypothetical protein